MPKSSKGGGRFFIDEPNMSDLTLLVSVEDLISIAMGPTEQNTVNYKMVESVLYILARQMRILTQDVRVNIPDDGNELVDLFFPASETAKKGERTQKARLKEEKVVSKEKEITERSVVEEQQNVGKMETKEKTAVKEKENTEKITLVEKKKYLEEIEMEKKEIEKMTPKEKEKYFKEKEQRLPEIMLPKEQEKYLRDKGEKEQIEKMTSSEKEKYVKDKENEKHRIEKMSPAENDKYFKDREREKKVIDIMPHADLVEEDKEEREIQKKSHIEKEKYLKEKEKEEKQLEKMSPKEQEKYYKDKEIEKQKLEKMSPKEKDKYVKYKEMEREESEKISPTEKNDYYKTKERENKEMEKMTPEQKKKYLEVNEREEKELQNMSPEEKEEYIKENQRDNEKIANITHEEQDKYVKDKNKKDTKITSLMEKEQYVKDKEREERQMEKLSPTENKQYLQDKENEQKALGKMTRIEKEQYLKEKQKMENLPDQKRRRAASGTSIASTEPLSHGSGIDIVTQSEFRLLEDVVTELKKKAGPLPMPTLPDSEQLKKDLTTGRASLTDTMAAMQVSARMQAAEQAVGRLAKMLTQLAAAGVLPEEFAQNLEKVKADMAMSTEAHPTTAAARKSVAIDPLSSKPPPMTALPPDVTTIASRASVYHGPVWQDQMDDALLMTKDDLIQKIQTMTQRATITAEAASFTTKAVVDNFDTLLKMNNHINALYSLSTDCDEHLTGFNSAFKIQMQSLNEEMVVMKNELKGALVMLTSANRHPESPVVVDLKERSMSLTANLDETLAVHQDLTKYQRQLGDELHSLMDLVEMLREEKADRDEVLDGLRDKAENSKLEGLVSKKLLESIRMNIEIKLRACYNKFSKQKATWKLALQDLSATQDTKAEVTDLQTLKENVKADLLSFQGVLEELAIQLAEPKAAILTRLLSKDGACSSCKEKTLLDRTEADRGQPFQLPALHGPPEPPCLPQWFPLPASDAVKAHACNRWVGGSHTLLSIATPRETALALPSIPPSAPSRHFTDFGSDGKIYYFLEEELLPCIECNEPPTPKRHNAKNDVPKGYRGGGDSKLTGRKVRVPVCDCLPTIP